MKKMMFNDRYGLTQAIISGRKTVTRRVIKDAWWPIYKIEAEEIKGDIIHVIANNGKLVIERKCPYKIGEIVAVAQSYMDLDYSDTALDRDPKDIMNVRGTLKQSAGWNNKMFVRAEACKHQIQITDIRIERLQDISDDYFKEGITLLASADDGRIQWGYADEHLRYYMFDSPREAFASLIDKVSGRGTWDRNPFVWRIEFELVK
ncbi:hypothetical protein [Alistipes ihumii]|uniref:hypothetical protein n=1 Tax=Alistipes ihumii TaxID=1470347 RepID=UPI00265F007F|nr:hypothetical protein [Alistipes ihumii]